MLYQITEAGHLVESDEAVERIQLKYDLKTKFLANPLPEGTLEIVKRQHADYKEAATATSTRRLRELRKKVEAALAINVLDLEEAYQCLDKSRLSLYDFYKEHLI